MKKCAIWLCIVALIATMTGCNKKSDAKEEQVNTEAKGCYVEREITKPELEDGEFQYGMTANDKGQLECQTLLYSDDLADAKVNCYTLVDGRYQKEAVTWVEKAVHELDIMPMEYCHGQDGVDYIIYVHSDTSIQDQEQPGHYFYGLIKASDSKDDYVDITPSYWKEAGEDGNGHPVMNLEVTKDKVLCYRMDYNPMLVFYDMNKDQEVTFGEFETYHSYCIRENTLYFMTTDSSEIQIQNLGEDKYDSITLDSPSYDQYFQVANDGTVYLLDNLGIEKYNKNESKWENIVEAKRCSMAVPCYAASDFILISDPNDSFYVYFRNQIQGKDNLLVNYAYDENAILADSIIQHGEGSIPKEQQKNLKVYSMWDNTSMRQAIADYTKLHPEVSIEYYIGMNDTSGATQTDMIRSLNTEILAGNGADIILMDGLPLTSYIQKGVLMDMNDIMSQTDQTGGVLSGIKNSYSKDGKVYCMPMRVYMPIYAMNQDVSKHTKTVEDIADYCQTAKYKFTEQHTYEELAKMLIYTYYNELFTEDGFLDQQKLTSFLNSVNEIAKQTEAQAEGDFKARVGEDGVKGANDRMREILCCDSGNLLVNHEIDGVISFVGDINNLQVCNFCSNGLYTPVNGTFVPNGLVGINATTKESELAKEFVTYLFSEETQALHLNDGFPVNEKALTSWIETPENEYNSIGYGVTGDNGEEVYKEIPAISVEDKKKAGDMLHTLTQSVYNDYIGMDMISQGTVEYLKGEKSLDQTASEIVEKVNLYLKE